MDYLPLIAALCGAIVGSALTSILAHLATARRELRQSRIAILTVLMSGRGGIYAKDVADSINIIPILFYDNPQVRRAHDQFCAFPNGPQLDLYRRYNELVLAVAKSLQFTDLTKADIDLGFYPVPTAEPKVVGAGPATMAGLRAPSDPQGLSNQPS